MEAPRTRYARSGDAHIAYQVVGDGPVDILLIPHFYQHLELWWEDRHRAGLVRALAEHARVILFDKRGTGMSERTGGVPPFDVHMDDMRAVLDAVGSERAVLWAGGDGAPMTLLFAATFPKRTLGLVLWNPFPTILRKPDMPWLMTRSEFDQAADQVARDLEDPMPSGLRQRLPSVGTDEELRTYWRASRLGTSRGDSIAFARVLVQADVRHVLPTIRVPTLVLTNEANADQHATTRYVAEKIPSARLAILPGRDWSMFVGEHSRRSPRSRHSSMRSWPANRKSRTASSRRFSSPTSLNRPPRPHDWVTPGGASCSAPTTRAFGGSLPGSVAASSIQPGTGSSRCSTGQPGPSAVRARFLTACMNSASRSAPGFMRASANCWTRRSPA